MGQTAKIDNSALAVPRHAPEKGLGVSDLPLRAWSHKTLARRSPDGTVCLARLKKRHQDSDAIPLGVGRDFSSLSTPFTLRDRRFRRASREILRFGFVSNEVGYLVTRDRFVVFAVGKEPGHRGDRAVLQAPPFAISILHVRTLDDALGCLAAEPGRVDSPCPPVGVSVFLVLEGAGEMLRCFTLSLPSVYSPTLVEPLLAESAALLPVSVRSPRPSRDVEAARARTTGLPGVCLDPCTTGGDRGDKGRARGKKDAPASRFKRTWVPQCELGFCNGVPLLAVLGVHSEARGDGDAAGGIGAGERRHGAARQRPRVYVLDPTQRTERGYARVLFTTRSCFANPDALSMHLVDGLLFIIDRVSGEYNLFDVAGAMRMIQGLLSDRERLVSPTAQGCDGTRQGPTRERDRGDANNSGSDARGILSPTTTTTTSPPTHKDRSGDRRDKRTPKSRVEKPETPFSTGTDKDFNVVSPLFKENQRLEDLSISSGSSLKDGVFSSIPAAQDARRPLPAPSSTTANADAQNETPLTTTTKVVPPQPRIPVGGLTGAYRRQRMVSGAALSETTERHSSTDRDVLPCDSFDDPLHLLPRRSIERAYIDPNSIVSIGDGFVLFSAVERSGVDGGETGTPPDVFLGLGFLDIDPCAVADLAFGTSGMDRASIARCMGDVGANTSVFKSISKFVDFVLSRSSAHKSALVEKLLGILTTIPSCLDGAPEDRGEDRHSSVASRYMFLHDFYKGVMSKIVGQYTERVRETAAIRSLIDTRRLVNTIMNADADSSLASLIKQNQMRESVRQSLSYIEMQLANLGVAGVLKTSPPTTIIYDACLRQYLSMRNDGRFQLKAGYVEEAELAVSPSSLLGYRRLVPNRQQEQCPTPSLLSPVAMVSGSSAHTPGSVEASCSTNRSPITPTVDAPAECRVEKGEDDEPKSPLHTPSQQQQQMTTSPHFIALLSPRRRERPSSVPPSPSMVAAGNPQRISSALVEYMLGSSLIDLHKAKAYTSLFPSASLFKVTITQTDVLRSLMKASRDADQVSRSRGANSPLFLWLELCYVERLLENNIDLTVELTSHLTECLLNGTSLASKFSAMQLLASGAFPNTYEISLKLFIHGVVAGEPFRSVGLAGLERSTLLEQSWVAKGRGGRDSGGVGEGTPLLPERRRAKWRQNFLPLTSAEGDLADARQKRPKGNSGQEERRSKSPSDFVLTVINNIITTDPLLALRLVGRNSRCISTGDWMRYSDSTGDWRVLVRVFERIAPSRIVSSLSCQSLYAARVTGVSPKRACPSVACRSGDKLVSGRSAPIEEDRPRHSESESKTYHSQAPSIPSTAIALDGEGDGGDAGKGQDSNKEMDVTSVDEKNPLPPSSTDVKTPLSSEQQTREGGFLSEEEREVDSDCALDKGRRNLADPGQRQQRQTRDGDEGMQTDQQEHHPSNTLDESSATRSSDMGKDARHVMLYAQWHYPFVDETDLQPVVDSCATRGPGGSSWSQTNVSEIKQSYLTTLININTRFML